MFDVVGLEGVFLNYPEIGGSGRNHVAAGILWHLARKKPGSSKWNKWEDIPERQRERLLLRTLEKLAEADEDEQFLILTA